MSSTPQKRRAASVDVEENPRKRVKFEPAKTTSTQSTHPTVQSKSTLKANEVEKNAAKLQGPSKQAPTRVRIKKLVAPRPFPAVATSSSATGPRSAHKEGKNYICLTRKTSLGAYMRRCKSLVINDGYKTLHLHAAGAAIPLLTQLSCALPPILPFSEDEIHTEIKTGTVEVQDEITPEDEGEDITFRSRGKSTLYIIIEIGDGQFEKDRRKIANTSGPSRSTSSMPRSKKSAVTKEVHVYQEPEQVQEDI